MLSNYCIIHKKKSLLLCLVVEMTSLIHEKRKRLTSALEFISSSSETETSTAFLNVGLSFEKLRFFFIKKGKV